MKIYELIYYSIATPSFNRNDIPKILEVAQANNAKNNITGCLLYYNDAFLQILEGDQEVLESLYAKIEQDTRHYNVREVFSDSKDERLFKNWSMAFFDIDKASDIDQLSFRENFMSLSKQTGESTAASELFYHIANQILTE